MRTILGPACSAFLWGSALFVAAACGSSQDSPGGGGSGAGTDGGSGGLGGEAGAGGEGGSGSLAGEISGLDPSFGTAGLVTLDLGGGQDSLATIAVHSDGSVFLVGRNSRDTTAFFPGDLADLFVARFTPSGLADPAFGTQGKALLTTAGLADARAAVVQADGKIVVVGRTVLLDRGGDSFLAARIAPDGTFDATFGKGGLVADVPGEAHAVALQADGKIVVVGDSEQSMAVVRYGADGARDASFGTGGIAKIRLIDESGGSTIAVQPDGAIVVTGYAVSTTIRNSHYEALVARLTPAGALDATFAGGGTELLSSPTGDFGISAMGLGPANAITLSVGENADVSLGDYSFERLTSTGGGDATFGTAGSVTLPTDVRWMALEPAGGIAYVTYLHPNQVFRTTSAGAPDPAFGTDGTSAATALPGSLRGFGRAADGSYFIGGQEDGTGLTAAHVSETGAADGAYGTAGYAIAASGAAREELVGVAVQADGKILTAGKAAGLQPFVERWDASGAPDTAFGTGGRVEESPLGLSALVGPVVAPGGGFYLAYVESFGASIILVRYDATGAHDATFGTKGLVAFNGGYVHPTGLAVDGQGRPVITTGGSEFGTLRYTTAGVLDETFGTKGLALASVPATTQTLAVLSDGRVLVAGGGPSSASVVRYTDSGTPDPAFGAAGVLSIPQSNLTVQRILPLADGAALLVGSTAATPGIVLARITAAGVLDSTFGTGGIVTAPTGVAGDAVDALLQGDGILVSTTISDDGLHEQMLFLRYTQDGVLDAAFGAGGQLKLSVGKGSDVATAMALDGAGRPIVVGRTWSSTTGADGLLLRLK